MPNHFYGIAIINGTVVVGAIHELPLHILRRKMTIPKIIGRFKMRSAEQINILRNSPQTPVWQRNYYEHVIRNDAELNKTREYIIANPAMWDSDEENPCKIWNSVVKFKS